MRSHFERFDKWIHSAPESERAIRATAVGFEDRHFKDLQLQSPAILRRLFTASTEDINGGEWKSFVSEPPSVTLADDWIFRLAVPPAGESAGGQCDIEKRTIWISPDIEGTDRLSTLLHEMIHAYEEQLRPVLKEWLVLNLHERLSKKISRVRLNRLIDASTHYIVHNANHGVLFLLKSLDIDLRCRWVLGTTFGYGRADMLQASLRSRKGRT